MEIKDIEKRMRKKYGESSVLQADDLKSLSKITYGVSAKSLTLDLAIGRPGFPAGRLTEIVGLENRGKSAHAYSVLAECQRLGGVGILLESEQGFESERLEKLGVNTSELRLCQPKNIEEAFGMIEDYTVMLRDDIKFDGPIVMVLDSVAGLPSGAEEEGGYDAQYMGLSARIISQGLRKLMWEIAKQKIVLIFLNQLRKTMNKYDSQGEYASFGGLAIGYRASLRMRVHNKASDRIMRGKNATGVWMQTTIIKNKIGMPFKMARYLFNYDTGIDKMEDLWQSALVLNIIRPSGGGFFKFGKEIKMKREQWPEFIDTKFKNVINCQKFLTQQAVKRGLLSLYG